MTLSLVITFSLAVPSADGSDVQKCPLNTKRVGTGCIPKSAAFVVYGERCRSARNAVVHYRALTWQRQLARGGDLATRTPVVLAKTCRWARFAADTWEARAKAARRSLERWRYEHTLIDYPYGPGKAWHKAVHEVQVVFPGTDGWLLSCSGAEGGTGGWVGYAGVGYSPGLRDSDTVGGNMQFRFSTFTGMWRRAVEQVQERGYVIPAHLRGDSLEAKTRAWRSSLGQALAAGWARYTGNDNSHWSASWNRGCS